MSRIIWMAPKEDWEVYLVDQYIVNKVFNFVFPAKNVGWNWKPCLESDNKCDQNPYKNQRQTSKILIITVLELQLNFLVDYQSTLPNKQ